MVAALIVLTSYLRFTVKKRGLAKNNWMELSWEHPYERKTHSLREVLKREEKQTAAVDLFPFGGHAVHKAGELQRMMNLPCLAELPVVVQKVRKNIRPLPRSGIEASARGFQNMETLQLRATKALEDLGRKTLLATNAVPGEGKSVVTLNLAAELARYGKKVL